MFENLEMVEKALDAVKREENLEGFFEVQRRKLERLRGLKRGVVTVIEEVEVEGGNDEMVKGKGDEKGRKVRIESRFVVVKTILE